MEEKKTFRTIGVLGSGGDAPGMNAAIRAVVRAAGAKGIKVYGIMGGYRGLLDDDVTLLTDRAVSNKIQLGGVFTYSDRCDDFRYLLYPKKDEDGTVHQELTDSIQARVRATVTKYGIDGLVCIGGDGTFRGAADLTAFGIPTIGVPGTIDRDITATDTTIGYDTTLNTAIALCDDLRDTCESHARCNIVELMGRDAGYIALYTAMASGAVAVIIPEMEYDLDAIVAKMNKLRADGKRSFLVIISEFYPKLGEELKDKLMKETKALADETGDPSKWIDTRFVRPAHIVRGGAPSAADRILATELGEAAVDLLLAGESNMILTKQNGKIVSVSVKLSQIMDKMYKDDVYTGRVMTNGKRYERKLKPGEFESLTPEEQKAATEIVARRHTEFRDQYEMVNRLAR